MGKRMWVGVMAAALAVVMVVPVAAAAGGEDRYQTKVLVEGAEIKGANGLAFDAAGRLLVGSVWGGNITAVDVRTGQIVERFGRDMYVDGADDVAVAADGSIYWTDILIGEVGKLAPDGTVTKQFVAPGVNPIAISAEGRVFVGQAFFGDGLYEVDPDLLDPPRVVIPDSGIPPFLGQLNGFDFGPDGLLYAPQFFLGNILRIDPDTGTKEVIVSGLFGPGSVEFNSEWELYANLNAEGTILRIDTTTGDYEVTLQVPGVKIDNMVFDHRDRLYFSDWQTGAIYGVAPGGGVRTILPGGLILPGGIAVLEGSDGHSSLFVADVWSLGQYAERSGTFQGADRNSFFDPGGVTAPGTVAADGSNLILSSWLSNEVQIWDPEAEISVDRYPFAVPLNAIRFQGDLIVAELGTGSVVRQDPAGVRSTLATAPFVFVPSGLAATDDDLWVADWATGFLWQLVADGTTLPQPQMVAAGLVLPEGMAVDVDGSLLVVESGLGRLSRVDPATGEVTTVADGLELGEPGSLGGVPTWGFSDVAVGERGRIYVTGDIANVIYRLRPLPAGP